MRSYYEQQLAKSGEQSLRCSRRIALTFHSSVDFHALRPLYHAIGLKGDHARVLSTPKSELRDPAVAAARLQRWWPRHWHEREMFWPEEETPDWPKFADVGVFEPGAGGLPVFRALTNLKDELESYVFTVAGMKDERPPFERLDTFVFRRVINHQYIHVRYSSLP